MEEEEEEEKGKEEAVQIIGNRAKLPRLVVIDLDYTLWPFYCECCYEDEMPHLYPHARGILYALKEKGIAVAIASRSPTAGIAAAFLDQLESDPCLWLRKSSQVGHTRERFQRNHRTTEIPFESMLFFDDEDRNIQAVSKMGVTSILVHNGITLEALRKGLSYFFTRIEFI